MSLSCIVVMYSILLAVSGWQCWVTTYNNMWNRKGVVEKNIPLLTPENPHPHSCHHPNGYEYYEQHQIQVLIFLCYQLNQKDLRNRLKSTESKLVQFNKYMQSLQSLCALMHTFASSTLVTHSK